MYHPNIKYETNPTMDNERPLQSFLRTLLMDTFRPQSELSSSSQFNDRATNSEGQNHRPDDVSVVLFDLLKFPISNSK